MRLPEAMLNPSCHRHEYACISRGMPEPGKNPLRDGSCCRSADGAADRRAGVRPNGGIMVNYLRKERDGVRELADGGTRNTTAGQPTDDSEMAPLLARMLVDQGRYDPKEARKAYIFWLGRDRIYSHP
jgi:hypothetical protein